MQRSNLLTAVKLTKQKDQVDDLVFFLAGAERLELSTRGFGDRCSTN